MGIAKWIGSLAAAATLAATGVAQAAVSGWVLIDIGTLGGPGSYATAVSNTGYVAGCSDVAGAGVHAFLYKDGQLRDLGTASDGGNACALAVNDAGVAAGRSGSGELVVWDAGKVTRLGVRGDVGGINNGGSIAGSFVEGTLNRAFLYKAGVLRPLSTGTLDSRATALNQRDEVVGAAGGHAFLYVSGSLRDLGTLGGGMSIARGINDRGDVVGMSTNAYGQPDPFLYDGVMRALPGGSWSDAAGINDRAQVVVSNEGQYGYVVLDGKATQLDALPAVRAQGWHHLDPKAINDHGWIVGTALNATGDTRAFLLIPRN